MVKHDKWLRSENNVTYSLELIFVRPSMSSNINSNKAVFCLNFIKNPNADLAKNLQAKFTMWSHGIAELWECYFWE